MKFIIIKFQNPKIQNILIEILYLFFLKKRGRLRCQHRQRVLRFYEEHVRGGFGGGF